jgi:septum formation protein
VPAGELLLASRSPRRARILEAAGIPFRLGLVPDVDESVPPGLAPAAAAQALAERKARAVAPRAPGGLVLCADTLVHLEGGEVLGKPSGRAEAVGMLTRLSGRTHQVATGVALARGGRIESGVDVARVTFRALERAEIQAYVRSGEPLDKAGAYAIQGGARAFVEHLEGAEDTVIGLPVALVRELLGRLGLAGLGFEAGTGR